jgi:serine/threonine protein kinase
MATVWVARQTGKHGFEKLVAIKTVLPKLASDTHFQTMFIDEARIAARIEHANVAQVLDVGEQNGITYLVMEYVDGESLWKIRRILDDNRTRLPLGVILRTLADVCAGLHAAHELRGDDGQLLHVVHRDVSPQNILLSMRGVAKLIDFGIAKARNRWGGDTHTGTVKGKARYMAPEQALGGTIDRRVDIWAVGAILYDLLSGRPPYQGENDAQILFFITSGRPVAPLPPSVHPRISAIVHRALSLAPNDRFATAAEMQHAIEEAMVETKEQAAVSLVASLLKECVGDRAKVRKDVISLSMKRAGARGGATNDTPPEVGTAASGSAPRVSIPVPQQPSPASTDSSGTLGSASVGVESLKPRRRSRTVAIVGAALGVALGAGWLVGLRAPRSVPRSEFRPVPSVGAFASRPASSNVVSASAPVPPTISVDDLPAASPTPTPGPLATPVSSSRRAAAAASFALPQPHPTASTASTLTTTRPHLPAPTKPTSSAPPKFDDGF